MKRQQPVAASTSTPSISWLLTATCLLALFVINAVHLMAELQALPARHLIEHVDEDGGWRDREKLYSDAITWIDSALALRPHNPDYHEIRARLTMDRCRHWDLSERWQAWQDCQQTALASLRQQVQGNPAWPYAWANLLLAKFQLRAFDEEFLHAWERCRALGRREIEVNHALALVGMAEWSRWNAAQRQDVRTALQTIQSLSPAEAKAVADAADQHVLYCLWTAGDPRQHFSCKRKPRERPPITNNNQL